MKRYRVIVKESENSGCRIKSDISGEIAVDFVAHSRLMIFHWRAAKHFYLESRHAREKRVENGMLNIVQYVKPFRLMIGPGRSTNLLIKRIGSPDPLPSAQI